MDFDLWGLTEVCLLAEGWRGRRRGSLRGWFFFSKSSMGSVGFLLSMRWSSCAGSTDQAQEDRRMMRRCVELAKRSVGCTRPNPIVGCVVTSPEGLVIGEGYHMRAGGPHAEVIALSSAGNGARGGTAFVSLEPCNAFGRTPPCANALIEIGVRRVVVGMVDPDPRTAGGGIEKLRANGIEVEVGVEEELCQAANEGFTYRITKNRPLGTWKYAMTLDGKIGTDSGSSKWISGPKARSVVQKIRREADAIIVGGNTVRMDDPGLTLREGVGFDADIQPLRVVMSRRLDLPMQAKLWDTSRVPTVVLTLPESNSKVRDHLRSKGVVVEEIKDLSPLKAMDYLYEFGALNVLWECGGRLAAEAVRDGCVQKVVAFIAPKVVGGSGRYTPLADMGFTHMDEALPLRDVKTEVIGDDMVVYGRLQTPLKPL